MAIKLEVGKRYELNNGEVHECTKMNGDDPLAVDRSGFGPFVINGCLYHQDGTFADRSAIQEYSGVKRCVDDTPKLWRDMTPEEKGALLLAHHEGKAIECIGGGIDFYMDCDPAWLNDWSYRVKPEPLRETIKILTDGTAAELCDFFRLPEVSNPTHCITFNTLDGIPDCASVKMEKL